MRTNILIMVYQCKLIQFEKKITCLTTFYIFALLVPFLYKYCIIVLFISASMLETKFNNVNQGVIHRPDFVTS